DLADAFQPEIVLLDLGMAVMDGYEVAARLRQRPDGARLKIVAVTGWGQEEDRRRARGGGVDHHLVKPVNVDILKGLLTEPAPDGMAPGLVEAGSRTRPL